MLAGIDIIDELFCASWRAAALVESPPLSESEELFFFHGNFQIEGKLFDDGQILRFAGGREADRKAEPIGQGKLFLHRIARMDAVLAVGEIFFQDMPAVGSGDDHDVM